MGKCSSQSKRTVGRVVWKCEGHGEGGKSEGGLEMIDLSFLPKDFLASCSYAGKFQLTLLGSIRIKSYHPQTILAGRITFEAFLPKMPT